MYKNYVAALINNDKKEKMAAMQLKVKNITHAQL